MTRDALKFHPFESVGRALQSLKGMLLGMNADGLIGTDEAVGLRLWHDAQGDLLERHPFAEVGSVLDRALLDGRVDEEERLDLLWLIDRLNPDANAPGTKDKQALAGFLSGVTADGSITVDELCRLRDWLDNHAHLRRTWPYDEVDALVTRTLTDGVVDAAEEHELLSLFSRYAALGVSNSEIDATQMLSVAGICACDPEITVPGRTVCITGDSTRGDRRWFENRVSELGGTFIKNVRKDLDYLVVGAEGSPCWGLSCYGRKVELAVRYRMAGAPILIVHEHDFWDAV